MVTPCGEEICLSFIYYSLLVLFSINNRGLLIIITNFINFIRSVIVTHSETNNFL